jgi:hypothetical protein
MEKILVTGTGRCGTTFLIKLFSFLNYDTGFNEDNYEEYIFKNCNSGMEKGYNENYYILKNPRFIEDIENLINDNSLIIKKIIIPIRDYKLSAKSRVLNGDVNITGGLWNATNEEEQLTFYNKILANYLYIMTKYNISTIFIDFDKMINDKQYLFDKLKDILDEKNITFDFFSTVYDKTSLTSKPNNKIDKF